MKKNKQNPQEIRDYVKTPNLTGVPKRNRENAVNLENIFQGNIHEKFPNLARAAHFQIQDMQRTLVRHSTKG